MLSHKYARKTARQWMGLVAVASMVIASGMLTRNPNNRNW